MMIKYYLSGKLNICPSGGMADAADSKSAIRNGVGVQVPSRAPIRNRLSVKTESLFLIFPSSRQ